MVSVEVLMTLLRIGLVGPHSVSCAGEVGLYDQNGRV